LRAFADTHPHAYTPEPLVEREATQRANLLALLCVLVSVMLTVGSIAWLLVTFG
jgi:hypothetical protein